MIIGSPSGRHAEHGIAAASRGVHVLVEKPIASNIEEGRAIPIARVQAMHEGKRRARTRRERAGS